MDFKEPDSNGLQPSSNGLQHSSNGLQPSSDGLQPTSDALHRESANSLRAKSSMTCQDGLCKASGVSQKELTSLCAFV